MHTNHVKRHMVLVHKAAEDANVRQIKKQTVETNHTIRNISSPSSLPIPLYWALTFIVLDKLWKTKKYVEASDVISSMFKFLKRIGLKYIGDYKEFLQFLSCYCYIKFQTTTANLGDYEQGERQIKIKHIKKGKKYFQLIRQIHSNECTFRYWKICQRMNLKNPVMRYNKQQFQEEKNLRPDNLQSDSNSDQDSFSKSFEYLAEEQVDASSSFTSVYYQIDASVWQFKKEFDEYCFNGKKAHSFLKKLDKFFKKEEFMLLLNNCCICNQVFMPNDLKRMKCSQCLTQIHEQCFQKFEKCICQQSNIKPERIIDEELLQNSYKTLIISKNSLLSRKSYQGISIFLPKTSRQVIDTQEEAIKKALYARDRFYYTTNAKMSRKFNVQIDLKYDPFLLQADKSLTKAYQSYALGLYKPPLRLKTYAEDNFGILALQTFPKFTLLGQYGADIIPAIYCQQTTWKDHLMLYYKGATSRQDLMLAPFNLCNFGPLLNHSQEGNCSSLRIIIGGSIRVLLYTIRKIKVGQQLLYDYNGFYRQYPTQGFEELND